MNHKSIKSSQKKLSIKCRNIYADNIIIYIDKKKKNRWLGQPNFKMMRYGFFFFFVLR